MWASLNSEKRSAITLVVISSRVRADKIVPISILKGSPSSWICKFFKAVGLRRLLFWSVFCISAIIVLNFIVIFPVNWLLYSLRITLLNRLCRQISIRSFLLFWLYQFFVERYFPLFSQVELFSLLMIGDLHDYEVNWERQGVTEFEGSRFVFTLKSLDN